MNNYFEWLKKQVEFLNFPERYDKLFSILHKREFIWKHPMDRNRGSEALELRNLYFEETGKKAPYHPAQATVLELLVSISKRMNFICTQYDEDKTKVIFWRLIANLGLNDMYDRHYDYLGGDDAANYIIGRFLDREYDADGTNGGLFPMANARQNQREIELWYQMNQYLSDPNGEDLKTY